MSSSSRDASALIRQRLVRLLLLPCLGVVGGEVCAADGFFIPDVALSVENHSNIDMVPKGAAGTLDESVTGVVAEAAAIAGWRSPRGSLELRPALSFQSYRNRDDLERTNGYLDAKADYNSQRTHFDLIGRLSKEDEYKFNLPEAGFNNFNPDTPDTTATGRLNSVTDTVGRLYIEPNIAHQFSERRAAGFRASYEMVDYNHEGLDRVDYSNGLVELYLLSDVSQRTKFETGVYASRYESDGDLNTTDSVGAALTLRHQWSPTFKGDFTVNIEQSSTTTPVLDNDKSTNFGASMLLERRMEVSRVRFEIGQYYRPSGSGTRARLDQARLQYSRDLSERWHFGLAARGFRSRGEDLGTSDRDYARAGLDLRWDMSRTWYLSGGYDYIWEDYVRNAAGSREDHTFRLRIGYYGLDPR